MYLCFWKTPLVCPKSVSHYIKFRFEYLIEYFIYCTFNKLLLWNLLKSFFCIALLLDWLCLRYVMNWIYYFVWMGYYAALKCMFLYIFKPWVRVLAFCLTIIPYNISGAIYCTRFDIYLSCVSNNHDQLRYQ